MKTENDNGKKKEMKGYFNSDRTDSYMSSVGYFSTSPYAETTKPVKVSVTTWNLLKGMKKENETFDDVIKDLLGKRTKSIGDNNVNAIKYARKTGFFAMDIDPVGEVGYEYEYNDIKNNKTGFVLDLKLKKIFSGKKAYTPTEFFGVDNEHKHYSKSFITIYLATIVLAINKELKIGINPDGIKTESLVFWRKNYYEYQLSEESFINDIEVPLKLSEEEKPSEEWKKRIQSSYFLKKFEANK